MAFKIPSLTSKAMAEAASCFCAFLLVMVLFTFTYSFSLTLSESDDSGVRFLRGNLQLLWRRPCDEIYVVGDGETLHSISHKCGDPFILENNPHIHDPDDVFPGLVLKITPSAWTDSRGARW